MASSTSPPFPERDRREAHPDPHPPDQQAWHLTARGQTGHAELVTQPLSITAAPADPAPASPPVPAHPISPPRPRGLRWLARLLRTYLTVTLLLVALVLITTPAPAEPAPGYRQEVLQQPTDGGLLETVSWWALRGIAWITGQAAERQRDLLQANPLHTRLFTPITQDAAVWVAAHRLPVELALLAPTAALVFYGVYRRPSRRWWLTAALLAIVTAVTVNFPAAPLTIASAPGLSATRQVTNWTSGRLLIPDADRAQRVQADAAEGLWTGLVTGTHSRLETGSNILVRVPVKHRNTVTAFLRDHGVEQASGLQAAIIAGFGFLSVVPWVAWITLTSLLGATAQTLTLLLMLAGLVVVPLLAVNRQHRRLLLWWLLPLASALVLTGLMTLASIGAAHLVVAATTTWEAVVSLASGSVVLLVTLMGGAWWARRRLRRWRQRPTWWRSAARFLGRLLGPESSTPPASADTSGSSAVQRKAGAA